MGVEEEDLGFNVLIRTLSKRLNALVNYEGIEVENVAIICTNPNYVKALNAIKPEGLQKMLCKKNGLRKQATQLQIVSAEDFATKCAKVRKRGKKGKLSGEGNQKKFLMVDTVRRFKGLEAEVIK